MTSGRTTTALPSGIGYAIRILIGTTIVWLALARIKNVDPLWAIISVVIVSEPELQTAMLAFKSRTANTLIGCAVGLLFLFVLGPAVWSILLAMAVSVVICTSFIRVPLSWRDCPRHRRSGDDAKRAESLHRGGPVHRITANRRGSFRQRGGGVRVPRRVKTAAQDLDLEALQVLGCDWRIRDRGRVAAWRLPTCEQGPREGRGRPRRELREPWAASRAWFPRPI
jgi:fusaric acid resistance family protein